MKSRLSRSVGLCAKYAGISLVALAFAGCARTQPFSGEHSVEARIYLLDSNGIATDPSTSPTLSFQPGEVIRCSVEVTNRSEISLRVRPPYVTPHAAQSSVRFEARTIGGAALPRRVPVHSAQSAKTRVRQLRPGESALEEFRFVTLTRHSGTYEIQAFYEPAFARDKTERATIPSNTVAFIVQGPPLWQRDLDGLLLQSEAAKVAIKASPDPCRVVNAQLRETKEGLHEWWLTVEATDGPQPPSERPRTLFVISPYDGSVMRITSVSGSSR